MAGRSATRPKGYAGGTTVAILARRDGRAQPWWAARCSSRPRDCCDPRPARWPGAARRHPAVVPCRRTVAILARRDGRAQLTSAANASKIYPRLRSSPGAMAGRSVAQTVRDGDRSSVAILARRDGRAQPVRLGDPVLPHLLVAILARRDGRAQHGHGWKRGNRE